MQEVIHRHNPPVADGSHPVWYHVAREINVPHARIPSLRLFFEEATRIYSSMVNPGAGAEQQAPMERLQELAAAAMQPVVRRTHHHEPESHTFSSI
jgi:hypothetical protein